MKIYPVKVQDLLADYLYQQKKLSLPSIGHFELDPSAPINTGKDEVWPEDAIRFNADASAPLTNDLLAFLVEHSGKMKPLAQSDLESFIINGLQLLNIGKPFILKGIGSLTKSAGVYSFKQGIPLAHKEQSQTGYVLKDRTRQKEEEAGDPDFSSEEKKSSKKIIIVLGSILALVLIAWAVYLSLPKAEPAATQTEETTDTVINTTPVTDTVSNRVADTVTTQPLADTSLKLAFIVQSFNTIGAATQRIEVLKGRGHNVTLEQKNDSTFLVVLSLNKPLSDSSYVRDSLQKFFRWKTVLYKK